jgi:hypothetical protein
MSMSSYENPAVDKLIRWGGSALIVSGVCLAVAYLIHPPEAPPETVASGMWIGIFAVGLSGFVPMLVVKVGAVIFGAGLALLGKGLLETESA